MLYDHPLSITMDNINEQLMMVILDLWTHSNNGLGILNEFYVDYALS